MSDTFFDDNLFDFGELEDEVSKYFAPEVPGLTNTDDATTIGGTNQDGALLNLEPSTQVDIVLEPLVPEPEEEAPLRVARQPRRRVAREHWGQSSEPVPEQHRPGRTPAQRDHEVSSDELRRRNRRREQNKLAAKRQREKRVSKVRGLEEEIEQQKSINQTLLKENQRLTVELESLRNQMAHQHQENTAQQMLSNIDDFQPTQYDYQHENYPSNLL